MDPIIAPLIAFLTPCVPYLMGLAGKAIDKAAEKAGEATTEGAIANLPRARKLWERLRPKVEADPAAKKAVEKAAANPEDGDRQTALKLALKDLLEELAETDPDLLSELGQLLEEGAPSQDKTYGDISAGTIYSVVQGDRTTVNQNFGVPPQ